MATPSLISRRDAKSAGLTRYYTGKPCPHGHVDLRMVSSYGCIGCLREIDRRRVRPREAGVTYRREWRARNREKVRAYVRKWAAANPDKVRANQAAWIRANPERWAAIRAAWYAANPEAQRVHKQTRRARERSAEGSFTADDIATLFMAQEGRCTGCSVDLGKSFHVDHDVPLSRGGSNWPSNLQLLCKPCNSSKGTRTMEEWQASRLPHMEIAA
jgi:5-methylcytosine-specific restriction endonuclease McrA